jgi:hypothetical protein
MNDHHFNILIAIDFDIETATFLNNMAHWLNKTIANRKNFYENTYWIYNSKAAFAEIFPYWTERQVRHILDKALANGLIISGNFNQTKYDRTLWYTFTDKAFNYYPTLQTQYQNAIESHINSTGQNCPIDRPPFSDSLDKSVQPIPDSNPDSNPNKISHTGLCENFEHLKNLYPNHEQFKKAVNEREKCLIDLKCQSSYRQLHDEIKRNKLYEDMLNECINYYGTQTKPQVVNSSRFLSWIRMEICPKNIDLKSNTTKSKLTMAQVLGA